MPHLCPKSRRHKRQRSIEEKYMATSREDIAEL